LTDSSAPDEATRNLDLRPGFDASGGVEGSFLGSERAYPRLGQAILLVGVLLGAEVIEGIILHLAGPGDAVERAAELVLTALTYVLVLWWAWRRTEQSWREVFCFQPVRLTLFLPLLLITVGFSITGSEADNLFRFWLPIPTVFTDILRDVMRRDALSFAYIGLVGPIFEELLFRGLILHGFLRHYRRPTAVLASAVLFAVSHLNPIQVLPALVLGVTYAWLRIRTRSLWPCLVAHSLNNSLVWLLSVILPVPIPGYTLPESGLAVGVFQPLWFDLVGLLVLALGFIGLVRTLPRDLLDVGHHDTAMSEPVGAVPGPSNLTGCPEDTEDSSMFHS
jgi:uncharacterized protein